MKNHVKVILAVIVFLSSLTYTAFSKENKEYLETDNTTVPVSVSTTKQEVLTTEGTVVIGSGSRTYYVSNDGDDNNSGLSEDEPWATLLMVGRQKYSPGDRILLRRSDVWHESLTIRSSGDEDQPLTFGNYGEGRLPAVLGSAALDEWVNIQGNIWVSTGEVKDPSMGADHAGQVQGYGGWPGGAWFENADGSVVWGSREKYINSEDDLGELKKEYDWGWYNDHVYIYSDKDPNEAYYSLQVSQRQYCIGFAHRNPQEYIVVDGIRMSYAQSEGFQSGYPEMRAKALTIKNCEVGFIGIKGGAAAYGLSVWHSDLLIQNNIIHDCGRRGVSYNIYTEQPKSMSFRNVVIEGNRFYNGFHTTGIDIANLSQASLMYFTIRNNLFEGDPLVDLGRAEAFNSNHIYTENQEGSNHTDFEIYNNVFTYCHGKGLAVSGISNCKIYNNTFYGVNPTLSNFQAQLYFTGEFENVFVRNNIFYNDSDPSFNRYFMCVNADSSNFRNIDMDNNLYYAVNERTYIVNIVDRTGFSMKDWEVYIDDTGWDKNSPLPQDPFFIDPPRDLRPETSSPAISAGVLISGLDRDITGKERSDPPSLGAYE